MQTRAQQINTHLMHSGADARQRLQRLHLNTSLQFSIPAGELQQGLVIQGQHVLLRGGWMWGQGGVSRLHAGAPAARALRSPRVAPAADRLHADTAALAAGAACR